jgi:hypothetical protein
MPIPNRELSQFGSFLYVDNTSRNIGIATTATPFVGIGTTNPFAKLTVVGDTNISGVVSATGYYLNGNPLVSAAVETWVLLGSDVHRLTGNVGIGTTIPTEKLDVIGNIKASGTITASRFISTVSSGTAPFQVTSDTVVANLNAARLNGKTAPSGNIVGDTDTQTLTNKTLTFPAFNGSGVSFTGSTSGFTTVRASAVASGTAVIPAISGIATFITTGDTGTVTSNMIADLNITNSDISTSAAIAYSKLSLTNSIVNADIATGAAIAVSKLASSTISGVSLGSNLNNLTAGSYITYSTGSTYNGSAAITVAVDGTSSNTANKVVARDSLGNFSGATITATDFNSTSDFNLKENIKTVENSLNTIEQLRGVSFDWKETGKGSYGVIAQELEEVLPELVKDGEIKSVNYNGLIGVLIEAVKELKKEIEELKNTK